jgi:hypothetical protein
VSGRLKGGGIGVDGYKFVYHTFMTSKEGRKRYRPEELSTCQRYISLAIGLFMNLCFCCG